MYKEYQSGEEGEEMESGEGWMGCMGHGHQWPKKMKKDFMGAMLRKKEKMLEAKLSFIREMKDMIDKMPEEMKEEKEEK
ncbi:MAG: hypothetical protein WC831_03765 [Parcubacteria group bacterium]|jgi:hypothetical protein